MHTTFCLTARFDSKTPSTNHQPLSFSSASRPKQPDATDLISIDPVIALEQGGHRLVAHARRICLIMAARSIDWVRRRDPIR